MREPKPHNIAPPKTSDFSIRVGVVLAEDKKSTIELVASSYPVQIRCGDRAETFERGATLLVAVKSGGTIEIQATAGTRHLNLSGSTLLVTPEAPHTLASQQGITLNTITAGRAFHWKKEVQAIFPGRFEISLDLSGSYLSAINEVQFEDYCACVVGSEMGAECPAAFLQAQSTVARSYSYVFLQDKHAGQPYQVCNDDCCQRYQGTTFLKSELIAAVAACRGDYLVNTHGHVCLAYYSKCCGGVAELAENVFGFAVSGLAPGSDFPASNGKLVNHENAVDLSVEENFLAWLDCSHPSHRDVYCSPQVVSSEILAKSLGGVDIHGEYYRWEVSLAESELVEIVKEKLKIPDITAIQDLVAGKRGPSGRILNATLRYQNVSGQVVEHYLPEQYDIRLALSRSFLYSSAFVHRWESSKGKRTLNLKGLGWGHGVGLCQIGGVGMALKGASYLEILAQYFPGCSVVRS